MGGYQYQQLGKEQFFDGVGEGFCVEDQGDVGIRQQDQGVLAFRFLQRGQVVYSYVQGKGEGSEEESGFYQQYVVIYWVRLRFLFFLEFEQLEGRVRGQQWKDYCAVGVVGVEFLGSCGFYVQDVFCRERSRRELVLRLENMVD